MLGAKKEEGSWFQMQDSKRILSEPKAVASKFNKFFATIGNKVACKFLGGTVARDAWKKCESNPRADIDNLLDLQSVKFKAVREILHSLRVNKAAGLDKIPARLVRGR